MTVVQTAFVCAVLLFHPQKHIAYPDVIYNDAPLVAARDWGEYRYVTNTVVLPTWARDSDNWMAEKIAFHEMQHAVLTQMGVQPEKQHQMMKEKCDE